MQNRMHEKTKQGFKFYKFSFFNSVVDKKETEEILVFRVDVQNIYGRSVMHRNILQKNNFDL